MNTAVLHRKVLGLPVWAVGGLGATGVILWHYFHTSGVGGASPDTTVANTDVNTGDPNAIDAGVPTQYGYGTGGAPSGGVAGDSSSGSGGGAYADALASLGDALAGVVPQAPIDNTADFSAIEAMLGTIADQTAPDHSEGTSGALIKQATHAPAAKKAVAAHSVAKARGGQAKPPAKKAPPKSSHPGAAKPVTHPKAATVAKHAPPPPPPKKTSPPKKKAAPKGKQQK